MSSAVAALVEELTKTAFSEEILRLVRTRTLRERPIVRAMLASGSTLLLIGFGVYWAAFALSEIGILLTATTALASLVIAFALSAVGGVLISLSYGRTGKLIPGISLGLRVVAFLFVLAYMQWLVSEIGLQYHSAILAILLLFSTVLALGLRSIHSDRDEDVKQLPLRSKISIVFTEGIKWLVLGGSSVQNQAISLVVAPFLLRFREFSVCVPLSEMQVVLEQAGLSLATLTISPRRVESGDSYEYGVFLFMGPAAIPIVSVWRNRVLVIIPKVRFFTELARNLLFRLELLEKAQGRLSLDAVVVIKHLSNELAMIDSDIFLQTRHSVQRFFRMTFFQLRLEGEPEGLRVNDFFYALPTVMENIGNALVIHMKSRRDYSSHEACSLRVRYSQKVMIDDRKIHIPILFDASMTIGRARFQVKALDSQIVGTQPQGSRMSPSEQIVVFEDMEPGRTKELLVTLGDK